MRPTTRHIRRWSVMRSSTLTNSGNDHDDDNTSHSLKTNNRQLLFRFGFLIKSVYSSFILYSRKPIIPSDKDVTTGKIKN
jgi:hypothetical protein